LFNFKFFLFMKRLSPLKSFFFALALMGFPFVASAQSTFQKVVKYLGQEDYMNYAGFLDSAQAVISLGYVTDSNNTDLLMRTDLQGNVVWERALVDGPNDYFSMEQLCIEGHGIFVGGDADGDSSSAAILRFEENGSLSWARIFSYYTFGNVEITALAGDQNGNVVFGGQAEDVIFSRSGMVGKIRASDGLPLWMSTIDDSVEFDVPYVASTPSGEVVAAGNVSNWPTSTVHWPWIAKWSATGTLLWCKKLDYDATVYGLKADADHIYLGGLDAQNSSNGHLFVSRFSQSGALERWKTLDNANESSFLQDMKLDAHGVTLVADHSDDLTGNEFPIIMRLDTALNPVFAWLDEYAIPYAIAGTDNASILHFVGGYYNDPNNDEVIVLGAIPDGPVSSLPCGLVQYAPSFVNLTPPVLNYAVTTGSTNRSGYAQGTAYAIPVTPLTDCGTTTAVREAVADIQVWPNPTTGKLHVQLPADNAKLMVMGLDGKVMLQTQGSGLVEMDLSGLGAGMYVLKVEAAGAVFTQRICRVE
jgi:hypothetical protein